MNKEGKFSDKIRSIFFRIPLSEKILFAKHLSMMIKAGMTEIESLQIIRHQIKARVFGTIIDKVIVGVQNGQLLSEALNEFRNTFGALFVSIIKLGEVSGTLAENLNYLADELRKNQQLRAKVRSALIYPSVILVATLGVVGLLTLFVLPRIMPVFANLKVPLPITTRILINIVNVLNRYYSLIIPGILAIVAAWLFLLRLPGVKYAYHRSLLLLPVSRKISVNYNIAIIMRTLGVLLRSGLKIVESVALTAEVVPNTVYKKALLQVANNLKEGSTLYKYFENQPSYFPDTVSRMIEVGEKTGSLNTNLLYLAEFYENEVDNSVKNLSSILEPALIVIMGLLVGFVAVSIISPMYAITQSVVGPS